MIRKAIEEDSKEIALLIIRSWKKAYRGLIPDDFLDNMSMENIEKNWKKNIISQNDKNSIFVYEERDKIHGVIRFGEPLDKENRRYNAEIHVLYVEPTLKRKGIGSRLFNFAKEYFIRYGKNNLIIWCLKGNEQGMNFYKKMGGKIVLTRKSTVNNIEVEEVGFDFKFAE